MILGIIRKTTGLAISLACLGVASPAGADDPAGRKEPLRYLVRFGATFGAFEPIAGQIQCIAGEDCPILLSIWPDVEIRLRSSPDDPAGGTVEIRCPAIECGFANGDRRVGYGGPVTDLAIHDGGDPRTGPETLLVLRRGNAVGRFSFAIGR